MGHLKRIAAAGVVLAAWICANGQTAGTPDQETPDSLYYVTTDYGWTMTSQETSEYEEAPPPQTFSSPLRLKVCISFSDLGSRLQMHLHFSEVSYTDERRGWKITDFSDPGRIRALLSEHLKKGAELEHFTELAAYEEEALGYMMALSHGMTFMIDLSADTPQTYRSLLSQVSAQARTAGYSSARAREAADRKRVRTGLRNAAIVGAWQQSPRLGMMWAHQIRHLAMFIQRPAYKTITPSDASSQSHQSRGSTRSPLLAMEGQTQVPAFSLCGLYRWVPMDHGPFSRLRSLRERPRVFVDRQTWAALKASGTWFIASGKTKHTVDEELDQTSSGAVEYRRIKIESRLNEVDAFTIFPSEKGIRGTLTVRATTTLEATLVDPYISPVRLIPAERLKERIVTRMKIKDYPAAVALCEAYLRHYGEMPGAEKIRQRLEELSAASAEYDKKRMKSWTDLAELGLSNGRPDVAREFLMKVISSYPETSYAAEARQRLNDLPQVSIQS
ncbi:MAG: tetratricopeptide repeat protein [Planctomycetota bacterium]|jgi:hypothetical protein